MLPTYFIFNKLQVMANMTSFSNFIIALISLVSFTHQLEVVELRNSHYPQDLSNHQISFLTDLSNTSHINKVLDNICIPRVVGTKSHDKVHDYIISELSKLGWHIEVDRFPDETPNFGTLTFRNIIASLNPNAQRYLVLSCHYDSKYFKDNDFEGATDSAVPCAMMLNLAYVMRDVLSHTKDNTDLSLKLIFFDGEEAFVSWGPNDSIYGAKHLANKLEQSTLLAKSGEQITDLQRIDILVLLDLIGVPNPSFYSYFPETDRWHFKLVDIEQRLASLGRFRKYSKSRTNGYFKPGAQSAHIEDDHIPFLLKGVPILHVIPIPFPREWHTLKDNRAIVDIDTVENINKIFRVFVAEYLHLSLIEDFPDDEEQLHTEL